MKICKALFILFLFFFTTLSNGQVLKTSSVQKVNQKGRGKNIKPKEHFCSGSSIEKVQCKLKRSDACKIGGFPTQAPVCAFDIFGVKFDFRRQCEACQNDNINYYFRSKCDKIPKICTKTQECVNGLCIALLNNPEDNNRIVCNEQQDCPSKADFCVANKCIDKRQLIKKLSTAHKINPELIEKSKRDREKFMKFQNQIRINDDEASKKLNVDIETQQNKKNDKRKVSQTEKTPQSKARGKLGLN